jgi:hypothetical protein
MTYDEAGVAQRIKQALEKHPLVARLLVIHAPAMDAYFAGLHELWARPEPPTPGEERALMAQFGMEAAQ